MRALSLPLLLAALALPAGCRSGRDYTSINRTSLEFLRETRVKGRALRRQNLRTALSFKERAVQSKRQRREGRAFIWNTLWKDMGKNFGSMLRGVGAEFHNKDFAKNARFGFLDSGE